MCPSQIWTRIVCQKHAKKKKKMKRFIHSIYWIWFDVDCSCLAIFPGKGVTLLTTVQREKYLVFRNLNIKKSSRFWNTHTHNEMKIKTKDLQIEKLVETIWNHIPHNVPFRLFPVLTGRRLFADNAGVERGTIHLSAKPNYLPDLEKLSHEVSSLVL